MQPLHSAQVIFYLTPIIVFLVTVGAAAWRFNIFSGGAREPAREGLWRAREGLWRARCRGSGPDGPFRLV